MKRIFYLLAVILPFFSSGQTVQKQGNPNIIIQYRGGYMFDSLVVMPVRDTVPYGTYNGDFIRHLANDSLYFWDGSKYVTVGTTTDGGIKWTDTALIATKYDIDTLSATLQSHIAADQDLSPTNELQIVTWTDGTRTLAISDGNSVVIPTVDTSSLSDRIDAKPSWSDTVSTLATKDDISGMITTEADPTVPAWVKAITQGDIDDWNDAFGWGNHAAAGYELQTNKRTNLASPNNTTYPTTQAVQNAINAVPTHDPVTITGQNYLTLLGQQITANAINLAGSHTTGNLPAARVAESTTKRFVTDAEKATWNGKQNALGNGTGSQYLYRDQTWKQIQYSEIAGTPTIPDVSNMVEWSDTVSVIATQPMLDTLSATVQGHIAADQDLDPDNEIQGLSFNATNRQLTITDGNTVTIPLQDTANLSNRIDAKENAFSKGNIVEGTGVDLTGTLTGRLVGPGNVTINAIPPDLSGYVEYSDTVSVIATKDDLDDYIPVSQKGSAGGVATLDPGGKVPLSQLPASLMIYKGVWDASTNTPTLVNGSGTTGWVYKASPGGTVNFGAGPISFGEGDWAIYNGTEWERSGNTETVVSVNGQQGVVNLDTDDIPEGANLYFTTARARQAYTGGAGISINNTTGVVDNTAPNATHSGDASGATVLTINPNVVTNAKLADMPELTIKGRFTGTGDPQDLTPAQARAVMQVLSSTEVQKYFDTTNWDATRYWVGQQGYLTSEVDGSVTNELQELSRSGTNVTLSDGGGTVSIADNDNDSGNEIQNLALGTATATSRAVNISSGTGATLPSATTTLAGLMAAADKVKLNGIQAGAEVNAPPQDLQSVTDEGFKTNNVIQVTGSNGYNPADSAGLLMYYYSIFGDAGLAQLRVDGQTFINATYSPGASSEGSLSLVSPGNSTISLNIGDTRASFLNTTVSGRPAIQSDEFVVRGQLDTIIPDVSGFVPNTRTITAGNGLTGGGTLAANRTITMGTPSSITLSSTNSVTTSSHTHAFTPGGTSAQYIRGDGNLATFPSIPTVNNGTLNLSTSGIATGSATFTANQSGNSSFTVNVPGTNLGSSLSGNNLTITSSTGANTTVDLSGLASVTPNLQQVTDVNNVTDNSLRVTGFTNPSGATTGMILSYDATSQASQIKHNNNAILNSGNTLTSIVSPNNPATGVVVTGDVVQMFANGAASLSLSGTSGSELAQFNTRVKGSDAINADEFVTLGQIPDVSGFVPNTRTITAGNGLSGGGNLTANRTITLGTPGTITLGSTNTVTASSHTHAFAPGGTTAQYIRGDGSLATFPSIPSPYVLPVATATTLGGIELFSNTVQSVAANAVTATASRTYGIQLNSAGQAVVNVPWTDNNTTYSGSNSIELVGTNIRRAALGGDVTAPANSNTLTIANGAVTTDKIANGAVTNDKVTSVAWTKITGAPTIPGSGDYIGNGSTNGGLVSSEPLDANNAFNKSFITYASSASTNLPADAMVGTYGGMLQNIDYGAGNLNFQLYMNRNSSTGSDGFWYRNNATLGGTWHRVASRDWVNTQIPSNYVTTNTQQLGLTGIKRWLDRHVFENGVAVGNGTQYALTAYNDGTGSYSSVAESTAPTAFPDRAISYDFAASGNFPSVPGFNHVETRKLWSGGNKAWQWVYPYTTTEEMPAPFFRSSVNNGSVWNPMQQVASREWVNAQLGNYVTTNTTQTGLSGDKTSTGSWHFRWRTNSYYNDQDNNPRFYVGNAASGGTNGFIFRMGASTHRFQIRSVSNDQLFHVYNDGTITAYGLSGTGTRMVVAEAGGNLATQAIPAYSGSTSITLSGSSFQRAALTGDVTAPANSNTLTIANDAVTFAKMQNINTKTVIGRESAGGGDPEQIKIGSGLDIVAGELIATGGSTPTNLAIGTRTNTTVPITNSNGTGATIPAATTTLAGVMTGTDKAKIETIYSGTYTPTVTRTAGSGGTIIAEGFKYMRVGDMVTVSGLLRTNSNPAPGAVHEGFRISLPISSNISNSYDITGHVSGINLKYNTSGTPVLLGNPTYNTADVAFGYVAAVYYEATVSFTYMIQ